MNRNVLYITAALFSASALVATGAVVQKKKPVTHKKSVAAVSYPRNTGLLGIHLLDPASRILALWGSPTRIEPLQFKEDDSGSGGGAFGGGEGGVGGMGGPPAGPTRGGGPGGKGGSPGLGSPAPPGGVGGIGGAGGGFEGEVSTKYTRWIYKKGAAMYAFIVDESNRVTQIDASGLAGVALTSGGIRLGSTFADIMRTYKKPDGYTFKGEIMEMRFLQNSNVLFQLHEDNGSKTQKVVYISVSAGK